MALLKLPGLNTLSKIASLIHLQLSSISFYRNYQYKNLTVDHVHDCKKFYQIFYFLTDLTVQELLMCN